MPTKFSPLISIIVPTFNHEKYIGETLENIAAQQFSNWECLIVDDGSIDKTKDICLNFQKKDSRFCYYFQENHGLANARNKGLQNCHGDFIQFLDSDDLIMENKFSSQLEIFQRNPLTDIVYSEYACFADGDFKKKWTYSRVELKNYALRDFIANWERGLSIPINCFLYRRTCFKRWGIFDERFYRGKEDWDLHIRFAAAGARFHYLPGCKVLYRVHPEAVSMARNKTDSFHFKKILYQKYLFSQKLKFPLRLIFFKRYMREIVYQAIARTHFWPLTWIK